MAVVAGCDISASPSLEAALSLDNSSIKFHEWANLRNISSDFLIDSLKHFDEAISSRPILYHCAPWPVKMNISDTEEEDLVFLDAIWPSSAVSLSTSEATALQRQGSRDRRTPSV